MRSGPVDNVINEPEGPVMAELEEYQYVVNNMVTTAMLTPEMAKRLNAKPVGTDPEELNGGYTSAKNARVYATTGMASEITGGSHAVKPVREQQQGIDKHGRTASMRAGTDADDKSNEDDDQDQDAGPVSTAPNKRRTPRDK